jgi:hypothetical protein
MAKINLDDLVDIAFAVEEGDPIDWDKFRQGREHAMRMIATSIIEQFDKENYTDDDKMVILATITKLVTENMILHSRILTSESRDS